MVSVVRESCLIVWHAGTECVNVRRLALWRGACISVAIRILFPLELVHYWERARWFVSFSDALVWYAYNGWSGRAGYILCLCIPTEFGKRCFWLNAIVWDRGII